MQGNILLLEYFLQFSTFKKIFFQLLSRKIPFTYFNSPVILK